MCDEKLVQELENAYRKYKTFIYYDNHSAIQRQKLAEFEHKYFYKNPDDEYFAENKEEDIFKKLADEIENNKINKYLRNINVIAFPKKMQEQESTIITNYHEITTDIGQIHYFIDLPVEAQILGVLWILRCGYVLDDKAYNFNCFGNRLNKTLLERLKKKEESQFSPFLFEPYYKKYESWRDGALEKVKQIVDEGNDSIMISLDFKNYYYSSLIDFEALNNDLNEGMKRIHGDETKKPDNIDNTLTKFVEDVFKKYQNKFSKNSKLTNKCPMFPLEVISSLSSLIDMENITNNLNESKKRINSNINEKLNDTNNNLTKFVKNEFSKNQKLANKCSFFPLDFTSSLSSLIDIENITNNLNESKKRINSNINEKLNDTNNNLTKFVKNELEQYQKNFSTNQKLNKYPFIPLGFLPSLIIANWNLQGFDQAIIEDIHPSYYGRYVDDILIVLKSHPKSESHGDYFFKNQTAESIIEKYFMDNGENPLNKIFYFEKEKPKKIIKIHNQKNRNNEEFCFHYENLEIQEHKVKLYSFNHENSTTIIDNFKNKILENSSEFKLMSDTEKLSGEFEDQLFKIEYVESINKLNDISHVHINKFEISKFMSGILDSISYTGNLEQKAIDNLIEAFENNIFEFFILWEKIFSILYLNNNYDELESLLKRIDAQINKLNYENTNKIPYQVKETDEEETELVKKSLKNFLKCTFLRVISLKSNNSTRNMIKKLKRVFNCKLNEIYCKSFKLIYSSMINNRLMKYPLQDTSLIEKMIEENKHDNKNIKYDLINENSGKKEIYDGFCYPRYIKFHEIILNESYNQIFRNAKSKDVEKYLDDLIETHEEINFKNKNRNYENESWNNSSIKDYVKSGCDLNCSKSHECPINYKNNCVDDSTYETFKIGDKNKTKLTIGLINTQLNENDFKKRLKGKPNLSIKRFNKINQLINKAIKNKVDLLIMPEMYIPPEWINGIARTCKINQLGMILGLESIVKDGEVYNYLMTILPFEYGSKNSKNKYYETMISIRLKNDYSPGEIQLIESNHLKKPEIDRKYYLYRWNGIHILPYVCYEIADIVYRSKFKSCCDIITVSEFNRDTNYFTNIAKSLSRDSYCYCIKSNASQYGGNCIIQPAREIVSRIVDLKGGKNDYLVIQKIDIGKIRNNAIKSDLIPNEKDEYLKPNPPGLNIDIIKERMGMESKYSKKEKNNLISPEKVKNILLNNLYEQFECLKNKTLSFWGLTFKPDVETSPARLIIENLLKAGAELNIYNEEEKDKFESKKYEKVRYEFESKYDSLNKSDALIILNKKDEFENYDISELQTRMNGNIIFDACNIISKDAENNGFKVKKIKFE